VGVDLKDSDAELFFKPLNQIGDGGLALVQSARCLGVAAGIHHSNQGLPLLKADTKIWAH